MPNNQVLNFLQENLQRIFIKSPLFFRIWQIVSGAAVLITGLPDFLNQFDIVLPEAWQALASKGIAWASSGMFFMTLLTTQSKPVAITETGEVLKKTDESKLPFTAKNEGKVADKIPLTEVKPTQ